MNTNDGVSQSASQTKDTLTQPFSGTGVPAFNYAIAVQQYQFQQSLLSQQLLAQHNAAAHAVSIKAAAEQAVARAAEISKLLNSSKDDTPKEKVDEPSPKRETSESKSPSRSQSRSQSSKSKSASPIRYRNSRYEHRQYSPRGQRNYRSRRTSPYYRRGYYDRGGFTRSSYRRDVGQSHGRYYGRRSRSPSRSRRRSLSRFRSQRYHHGQSRSPIRRHRFRSPSPKSDQRMPVRDSNRHSMSKSPINSSSISSSPQRSRIRISKKLNASRSLSVSGNSQSRSSSENHDAFDLDVKQSKKEATPSRGHFMKSDRSNSLSRSGNTSTDYSGLKNTQEPRVNQAVPGKLTYTDRGHSSSSRSLDEGSVPHRASDASDDERHPVSSNNIDHPVHVLSQHSSGSDETYDGRHDGKEFIKNKDKKLRDSIVSRRRIQDYMKARSVNSRSLSRENSLSDHTDKKKKSDGRKGNAVANEGVVVKELPFELNLGKSFKSNNRSENELPLEAIIRKEESAYFSDAEMDKRMEEKINHWSLSKEVEYSINDNINSMDGKMVLQKTLNELKPEEEYDSGTLIMLQGEFASRDAEQVSGSPATVCQYPQERPKHKSKSREKRRKHSRRRRKRRKGEVSEECDDYIKDNESERKSKINERKDHRRHHKSRKQRKRRKRKYRDTPSSSCEESSSSDDEDREECHDVPRKRSNGSRKKKGGTVQLQ